MTAQNVREVVRCTIKEIFGSEHSEQKGIFLRSTSKQTARTLMYNERAGKLRWSHERPTPYEFRWHCAIASVLARFFVV